MDQKKTCLPHLKRLPKDLNDECLVQMHLVGCLVYNGTVKPHVFITYPNVHNEPNLTIIVIQRVLMNWGYPLPLFSTFNSTILLGRTRTPLYLVI